LVMKSIRARDVQTALESCETLLRLKNPCHVTGLLFIDISEHARNRAALQRTGRVFETPLTIRSRQLNPPPLSQPASIRPSLRPVPPGRPAEPPCSPCPE